MLTRWHFQNELAEGEDYAFAEQDDPDAWGKLVYRPCCWPPAAWLPLSKQFHDSYAYIDLLPGPKGQIGQLVYFAAGNYEGLVAPSFENYLTVFTQALERKELQYDRRHQQWLGLHEALQKAKAII